MRVVRRALPSHVALIGFAGAPFTVASYVVEGGASRDYLHTKRLMYEAPAAWHRLMDVLADATATYLNAQIDAGAQLVQLFDSWVGALSPDDYRAYVLPHSRSVMNASSDPSGDHAGHQSSAGCTAIWLGFEPSAFMIQRSYEPPRFDPYAMRVPSGDQVGC